MQSERLDSVSRSPRVADEGHANLPIHQHAGPDVRRFAAIFPPDIPEAIAIDCDYAMDYERDIDSDESSRWEFVTALDDRGSSTQVGSASNVDDGSTLSAAEQIIAEYRAIHGTDHAPECSTAEIKQQVPPQIPDDQRSMYTLATSMDTQSTMDMMWRPRPKIHMHRTYRRELMQAQCQAIAMMHNAGLKPTNKIQCRRQGCADILPNVEALKYHIHIHNIADVGTRHNDTSCAPPEPCMIERSSKTSKNHSGSKSSRETRNRYSRTCSPPGKLSTNNLLPAFFSSRENTPEAEHVPSLTAVAKALVSDPSPSSSASPPQTRNNSEAPSARPSTHSRGRSKRKKNLITPAVAEYNPSIAMLLSSPPSPHDCPVLAPRTNSPVQLALNPTAIDANTQTPSKKLMGSRSPIRALSPTRAISPIRNGFKRLLSIGYSVDFTDK